MPKFKKEKKVVRAAEAGYMPNFTTVEPYASPREEGESSPFGGFMERALPSLILSLPGVAGDIFSGRGGSVKAADISKSLQLSGKSKAEADATARMLVGQPGFSDSGKIPGTYAISQAIPKSGSFYKVGGSGYLSQFERDMINQGASPEDAKRAFQEFVKAAKDPKTRANITPASIPGPERPSPEAPKKQSSSTAKGKRNVATGKRQPAPENIDQWEMDQYMKSLLDASKAKAAPAADPLAGLPSRQLPSMTRGMHIPEGEQQELESMMKSSGAAGIAGEIPKTKAGLKKFMQEYGKFIALGAMAGQGGKGGQIAAPIIAALPGLIEMMKGKKSSKSSDAPKSSVQTGMAHGGSVGKKSSGGEPPKKSEGGAIRKFKGGSMKGNSMDSMLTPKYAKGGKTDKMGKMGKAAGEMPQHKKMAMGKPTPQSTGQKFAKGGAAKYAGGGMCKGYGISKKIRPTGPMN